MTGNPVTDIVFGLVLTYIAVVSTLAIIREETNADKLDNALARIPQETDATEFVQVLNNLRDAYTKTGKKQTGVVVLGTSDEVVLTIRPKSQKKEQADS